MKLSEKQEFGAMFKNYELFNFGLKKYAVGQMTFMQCVMKCLAKVDCNYLKHGNISTNDIDYSDVKECAIWTPKI